MKTKIETINPIEFIEKYTKSMKIIDNQENEVDFNNYIKYDKKVNKSYDYRIIRTVTHDGLLSVTYNRIVDVIIPLLTRTSYCKHNSPENLDTIKGFKYTIGDIILESTFGMRNINGRKIHGEKDIITLPVKVEYILE